MGAMSRLYLYLLGATLFCAACGSSDSTAPQPDPDPKPEPRFGAPATLRFQQQPADALGGTPFLTQPILEVLDKDGIRVESASSTVKIAVGNNPVGGALSGNMTVNAVRGVANFVDLSLDKASSGYTLVASSDGLVEATTAPFNVLVGPASADSSSVSAELWKVFAGNAVALTLMTRDAGGNNIESGGAFVVFITVDPRVAIVSPAVDNGDGTYSGTLHALDSGSVVVTAFVNGSVVPEERPTIEVVAFSQVVAGLEGTCGLEFDGTPYCWGKGNMGQLGNGTTDQAAQPLELPGNLKFQSLSRSWSHTCGVSVIGAGYCWGLGTSGQLGHGLLANEASPVLVAGGFNFLSISAGKEHTCGVVETGEIVCWGRNDSGQLGNGSTSDQGMPFAISSNLTFRHVDAGVSHTCAVATDADVYCWGSNNAGQLGIGSTDTLIHPLPVLVSGGLEFRSVASGAEHTCGESANADVWCWGAAFSATTPTRIAPGFSQVTASDKHTCGALGNGQGFCWGNGSDGQLGGGLFSDMIDPVFVTDLVFFRSVSAGVTHSCGVSSRGGPYCWGSNSRGELGRPGTMRTAVPVSVLLRQP